MNKNKIVYNILIKIIFCRIIKNQGENMGIIINFFAIICGGIFGLFVGNKLVII